MKKAKRGRPPRKDNPTTLTVLLPGELKRWLRIRAADEMRDMGDIVTDALSTYRKRATKPRRREK